MNQQTDLPTPCYVTCRCQYCNKGIEFDANGFSQGETRTVECPHCNLETVIFVPPPLQFPKAARQATAPSPKPSAANSSLPSQIELFFYKIGESEKGPYTFEQLRTLWNNGQITGDALYRSGQASDWQPLSVRIGQQSQNSFPPVKKLQNLLLKGVCILSLIAFFLPNASISLPIFGKVQVSMFNFLTPKSEKTSATDEKPDKPNIKEVVDSNNFQIKKANAGAIICALSVIGISIHYLLTVVWGVLTLVLKRTFSLLNTIWLSLAVQFPILFSIGAYMAITAVKTNAMSDAGSDTGDNSPGAAFGTALGAALLNQISMQPGAVMWILMTFAALGMSLPLLVRQFKSQ
jgi:hypothetical protein